MYNYCTSTVGHGMCSRPAAAHLQPTWELGVHPAPESTQPPTQLAAPGSLEWPWWQRGTNPKPPKATIEKNGMYARHYLGVKG